jgi:hypothetical protein
LLDAIRGAGDRTPFVFYSASDRPEHKQETQRRGGQGYTNSMVELSRLIAEAVFVQYHERSGKAPEGPPPSDAGGLARFLERLSAQGGSGYGPTVSPLLLAADPTTIDDQPLKLGPWITSRERHVVGPTPPFRIGVYPVRNLDFHRFVESGGYEDGGLWSPDAPVSWLLCRDGASRGPATWESAGAWPRTRALHPVSGVSFFEGEAYCRWLNWVAPKSGWSWQLPTEDMWEFAARLRHDTAPTRYPWGDRFAPGLCNCASEGARWNIAGGGILPGQHSGRLC